MDEDLHKMNGPAFVFDPGTYFFLDANSAFLDLYGYTLSELKEMRIIKLRPPDEIPEAIKLLEDTKGNVLYSGESTHQKKNGDKMPVQVYGKRFHKDNKEYYLVKIKPKEES